MRLILAAAAGFDTPHTATGTLRHWSISFPFGAVEFKVPAGTKTFRFTRTKSGKRLTRGRYTLTLRTGQKIRFRVR